MSTLESAITISLILLMLSFMIAAPEAVALDSFDAAKHGGIELFDMEKDREIIYSNVVDGATCYDTSPEKFNTFLTGLSDNYRLIYGTVFEFSKKEAQDEEG